MIKLMTVLTAEDHPKADSLMIYTLRSTLKRPVLQVCANLTNVYEPGDIAAVAQVGHDFGEEFIIGERKVMSVLSQGMMLGKHEGQPGKDVSSSYKNFDPS